MIATSRTVSLIALSVALAVHAFGLDRVFNREDIQIEGAAGATETSMGNSFADMATGTMTALETEDMAEEVTSAEIVPDTAPEETIERETSQDRADPTEISETTLEKPVREAMQTESPSVTETSRPETTIAAAEPITLAPTVPLVPVAPSDTAPQEVAQPVQPQTVETLEAVEEDATAVSRSLRPKPRTKAFEEKHEPEPPRVTQPKAQPQKEQPAKRTAQPKPQAQPKGNAQQNATTGTATGQSNTKSAATGTGTRSTTGNAAASNYPGQVMKRISRVPRPRVGSKGTAVVAFKIASNGGLAGLSLARSSGSAKLDQAALKVIRRAAPFPVPPAGARRSFSIQIKGR